jgi:hypothetical protein
MVDIETLGTKANSVILSIGAVQFDLRTGKLGKEFHQSIEIQSCLDEGLEIMESTRQWWEGQPEAWAAMEATEKFPLKQVMADFRKYMGSLGVVPSKLKIWGNSNRFDLNIIENAYMKLGEDNPWKFYNEKDVRTLAGLAPWIKTSVVTEAAAKGEVLHDALVDCKVQVEYCHKTFNHINAGY